MPSAWSDKDERQYEHIKDSETKQGRSVKRAKRVHARNGAVTLDSYRVTATTCAVSTSPTPTPMPAPTVPHTFIVLLATAMAAGYLRLRQQQGTRARANPRG